MARPKKGYRSIVVDGAHYRWRCDDGGFDLYLEDGSLRGQRLCIYHNTRWIPSQIVESEIELRGPTTPSLIREIILDAIDRGWKPRVAGADFAFKLRDINP